MKRFAAMTVTADPVPSLVETWAQSLDDLAAVCSIIDTKLARAQRTATRGAKTDIQTARAAVVKLRRIFEPELQSGLALARQAAAEGRAS